MSSSPSPRPSVAPQIEAFPPVQMNMLTAIYRLLRIKQWTKGIFVIIGPAYSLVDRGLSKTDLQLLILQTVAAFFAFAFASSSCYIINDIRDREQDRVHPRKRKRPIAAGVIPVPVASVISLLLLLVVAGIVWLTPGQQQVRVLLGVAVGVYIINVNLYSVLVKHIVVADTISLALGFVLRVLGGCAATGVVPSSWLLNVTFFVSMFLALGKRLGERRTMAESVTATRGVQAKYTDELLRMAVVVTGVATLLSYSDYVQAQSQRFTYGFNLLWLTMLPATFALLRCIVLVERGMYDDPTELAVKDRPFQVGVLVFALIAGSVMLAGRQGYFAH